MTAVLLTIDTELSPAAHHLGVGATENFSTAILGRGSDGEWGIKFQIDRFRQFGVKAVFFVEALSANVVGLDLLKRTLEPILSSGHEVQLHAHTEWLPWFSNDPVDGRRGSNLSDFSYDDQCRLLQLGVENLTKAGAPTPIAFRAGNYGANNDTLRALASLGIRYDTSYNFAYLGHPCKIVWDGDIVEPVLLNGVTEVPISTFVDYPSHLRPVQLCAVSATEMRTVIAQSSAQRRKATVIVSHSFELLNRARTRANRLVVARFEKLCETLRESRTSTAGFLDLDQSALISPASDPRPLQSGAWRTAARMLEQAVGTALYGWR